MGGAILLRNFFLPLSLQDGAKVTWKSMLICCFQCPVASASSVYRNIVHTSPRIQCASIRNNNLCVIYRETVVGRWSQMQRPRCDGSKPSLHADSLHSWNINEHRQRANIKIRRYRQKSYVHLTMQADNLLSGHKVGVHWPPQILQSS